MRETLLHVEEEIADVEREYFAILDKIAELVREKEVFERSWSQIPAFLDDAKKLDWYGKSWEYKNLNAYLDQKLREWEQEEKQKWRRYGQLEDDIFRLEHQERTLRDQIEALRMRKEFIRKREASWRASGSSIAGMNTTSSLLS